MKRADLAVLATEDLVMMFAKETAKYWELSQELTLEESRQNSGRKDLNQAVLCADIKAEILSRSSNEVLKLKGLLQDPHPGVRLRAAGAIEDLAFDDAVATYKDLWECQRDDQGHPNAFGAGAGLALMRLADEGRIAPIDE